MQTSTFFLPGSATFALPPSVLQGATAFCSRATLCALAPLLIVRKVCASRTTSLPRLLSCASNIDWRTSARAPACPLLRPLLSLFRRGHETVSEEIARDLFSWRLCLGLPTTLQPGRGRSVSPSSLKYSGSAREARLLLQSSRTLAGPDRFLAEALQFFFSSPRRRVIRVPLWSWAVQLRWLFLQRFYCPLGRPEAEEPCSTTLLSFSFSC